MPSVSPIEINESRHGFALLEHEIGATKVVVEV